MTKRQPIVNDSWFSSWTRQTMLWVALAFVMMSILQYPFVSFFDTILTRIGFLYIYFWALPQAIVIYFIAFKFRVRWSSTLLLGLLGILGAPIDYYFEWVVQKNLLSPIHAFLYIPLYFLVGLSADVSLVLLRPERQPRKAALVSSCIFTLAVLVTTIFATFLFYPMPVKLQGTWLDYAGFLIPYSLITGVIGGYIGYSMARDTTH
jgi:hypothetical protein